MLRMRSQRGRGRGRGRLRRMEEWTDLRSPMRLCWPRRRSLRRLLPRITLRRIIIIITTMIRMDTRIITFTRMSIFRRGWWRTTITSRRWPCLLGERRSRPGLWPQARPGRRRRLLVITSLGCCSMPRRTVLMWGKTRCPRSLGQSWSRWTRKPRSNLTACCSPFLREFAMMVWILHFFFFFFLSFG